MKIEVKINGKTYKFDINKNNGDYVLEKDGKKTTILLDEINQNEYVITNEDKKIHVVAGKFEKNKNTITVNNCTWDVVAYDSRRKILKDTSLDENKIKTITSSMPGKIIAINIKEGEEVEKDQPLLVMEAMKMENLIKSPKNGKIKKINVKVGDSVESNTVLLEFE